MSGTATPARFELSGAARSAASLLFGLAGVAVVALFVVNASAAARGWLAAYATFAQVTLGSLALLLLDELTGTTWGRAFKPLLKLVACGVFLLPFLGIPIALHLKAIYPWATGSADIPASVANAYLNTAGFLLRSVVAFAGWIVFAALLLIGMRSRVTAALGMIFFGISSYVFGFDWILSIGAPFISSSFNAEIAIQSLLAALAACAVFAGSPVAERARADLGGLTLAAALGLFYFALMFLIVDWYGNQPDQAEWYLDRGGGWYGVVAAAAVFAAAIPVFSLLFEAVRNNALPLRIVGACALLGIALHNLWLLAPLMSVLAIAVAVVGVVAIAGLLVSIQRWARPLALEKDRADVG